ncbi:TDT family transporter [Irregularibacter muris]|uniref:TDT family transporter n=1 Tax=Irregularibacter muris TaxID=1796619 RepID=A0AAE3KYW0_9FIRM|nr:TDT family transporter [Irregularibacter muris]MCR1898290.1 TDT family transporter [Irregularibacter muris]
MNKIIKNLPLPVVGLMLALATTGNLVLSYGEIYKNIFGILSTIILALVVIKIIKYPREVAEDLKNPVVASVFPTLSMGIILLAAYIKPYLGSFALGLWILGLVFHVLLLVHFTRKYVLSFTINKVFPSWFIVYVGIVVGSVTAPVFDKIYLGQIIFWFGFLGYLVFLPIILYRTLKVKGIPEPALPTLMIFSAPASLCLAGYINSFPEKNMFIIGFLLALSQFTLLMVLIQLPKLLKLKFYPSYSAFTFPLAISAISIKLVNGFLTNAGRSIAALQYLVKFEELLALTLVLYVLFRYIHFLLSKSKSTKVTTA